MAGEIDSRRRGSASLMRSIVARMFAPGWRRTIISTARLPSIQAGEAVVLDVVEDRGDVAEAHGGAVLVRDRRAGGRRRRRGAGRWRPPSTSRAGPLMRPLGWFDGRGRERVAHVALDEAHVRRAPATSTCTRTAGCWPPPTKTCPTPVDLRDLLREDAVGGVEDLRERQRVRASARGSGSASRPG